MAYSLPSFSAAANYAASYRPIFNGKTLADGYKGIKSDEGVAAMQNVYNADFLAKVGMAKNALQEFGAMKRQELVADVARERLEAELQINDQRRSDSKKAALTKLLGGGLGDVVGSQLGGGDLLSMLAGVNTLSDTQIARDGIRSRNLGVDLRGTTADSMTNLVTDTGMTVAPSRVTVKPQLQAPPKLEVKPDKREPIDLNQLLRNMYPLHQSATPAK